ncbi:MAG: RHS repeat-associated core domain-containing protein [Anaerolineales bacterium]|nr:RHS repeat-associated core domain-containing protein [Anaerolineales bacterium]
MLGDFRTASITPPTRPPHDFGYTPADLVDTYTPPEAGFAPRHTRYAYNADGQLTAVTRPDGQELLPSYEPSGRLDFVTLPTGVVDLSYDAASGRVSTVAAPGGFQSTFGYEGPLLTSIATSGPVAGAIGFSYDADLRLAGRTVAGGAPVAYEYDPDGLLVRAGELDLGREAASGWLATTALGVTSEERTRTGFGELDVFTARIGGSVAYAYDLDRDAGGRITRRTETIGGVTAVWEYGYHPERGWLTEVRRDGVPVASYGYDGNGNRTSWSDFWGSGVATYDAQDRQLTAGAKAFTYTANGERLTESAGPETTSYAYDIRGSLLGVELPDGIAIEYLVDASGRRIGKRVDGVLTQGWLYAGGLAPAAETDGTGAVTKTFVYGTQGHVPDYLVAGGTTYRMLTDHLGSVRLVVDATSGAVVQRLDYDAWGRITYDSNPGWQPFGFAGGLYDPQTGLVRFGARDYDPEVGRWTAKDPIGFEGGSAGLFEYSANDPVNSKDPSGLYRTELHLHKTHTWALQEDFSPFQADMIASYNEGMDHGWKHPFNPFQGWRHFRERVDVERDLYDAIEAADLRAFGEHLHELQDTFSHAGRKWFLGGHALRLEFFSHWGFDYEAQATWTDTYDPCSERDKQMERLTRFFMRQLIRRLRRGVDF